jgi:hypothetical protein
MRVCERTPFQTQSRTACPELVERGRLKVVQDWVAACFQPSPFDKLRAGSAGLGRPRKSNPGLASWAKFSRPCGTKYWF